MVIENAIVKDEKYNTRLYPIYKALSWDFLFYYPICFLFLTQVKHLSGSSVLFTEALYTIFRAIFQIPCSIIVGKIGNRKGLILGNISLAVSIFVLLISNNIIEIIIFQLVSGIGFNLKNITESAILFDSIPKSDKRNDIFSKIESRANSYYYYLEAITASITGFLYVFNGYFPMIACFILCIIAVILSTKFKELNSYNTEKVTSFRSSFLDLKQAFRFIFNSKRLKDLLIFNSIMCAILSVLSSLRNSILTDIKLPEQYFGIVFAILGIISALTTHKSNYFHNRFRNRTLKFFGITMEVSLIAIGLPVILNFSFPVALEIILIAFALQYIIKGPFYTLIKRYLSSFSTSSMRPKILSAAELLRSIVQTLIALLSSFLLSFTNTAYVFIIIGCIITVILTLLLDHMNHTVGLKPEEYSDKDIRFVEVH